MDAKESLLSEKKKPVKKLSGKKKDYMLNCSIHIMFLK